MNRPPSRWQIRRAAAVAFAQRNRFVLTPRGEPLVSNVRAPDRGELPLSDSEIWHGVQHGLIAVQPMFTTTRVRVDRTSTTEGVQL